MEFANVYHSRFEGHSFLKSQILSRVPSLRLRPCSTESIVFGCQKLVHLLVYEKNVLRHVERALSEFYQRCYRRAFQEINDLDYSMGDYHTYGKHTFRLEFLQTLFRMPRDAQVFHASRLESTFARIHLRDNALSMSNNHQDRACQLSPRSAQYHLQYTYCACRVPFDVPSPGR